MAQQQCDRIFDRYTRGTQDSNGVAIKSNLTTKLRPPLAPDHLPAAYWRRLSPDQVIHSGQ